MDLKVKLQRESQRHKNESEEQTKYTVIRHITMRIRTNQNENEEQRNVWLEDIRPREQRNMQLEDNQQRELQATAGIRTCQR